MATTRERIREHVYETPGVHQNQLGRDLDLATGQLQYHLHRLTTDEAVVAEQISGKTHYYSAEFDPWERRMIAFLRRETPREIIVRLHAEGASRPTDLASELDLARSTIAWNVSNLVEYGLVEKSTDEPMTLELSSPERTAVLLEDVSPSMPDRLVDRFIRTVDELLD